MAIAHDAASESHAGTIGSTNQTSFLWIHTPVGIPRGVLVFTFVNANANDALAVTYGAIALTAVPGARAVDTLGEPGDCKAWFLGASVPAGARPVVVSRTSNANVMYAVAITMTAAANTEVKGTPILLQENGTLAAQNVNSGAAVVAWRYAGVNSGLSAVPAGANSTLLHSIDFGLRVVATAREFTAGAGSRPVGFSSGLADDRAAVHLAIGEVESTLLPSVSEPITIAENSVPLFPKLLVNVIG